MIIDVQCRPVPPSDIMKRVKQVHPALSMWWHPLGGTGNGTWCFTETWKDDDPRREYIRQGKADPKMDFDIIGDAPIGVKAEDAYHVLVNALRARPETKADYNEMLARVANFNVNQSLENTKEVREFAAEMVETNAKTLHRAEGKTIPKVYMNESLAKKSRWGK